MKNNLDYNSFLQMIDFENLTNSLKNINTILRDEQSQEWLLIISIDNTRKIINHVKECMDNQNITHDQKIDMYKNIIVIHQDLTRLMQDKNLNLSDKFYNQAQETLENLIIFYPVFIFNKSLLEQKKEA
ncbi:MAG: hypothetical protein L0I93_06605 [Atopostipes suicloacalis]|nr:hypothetical protein [Atopostipes suicloacalis]